MSVRAPTAAELAGAFGGGLLAVVGPEPVEGPFAVGPLVNEAERPEQPPLSDPGFVWEFWAGPDLRLVRIETYPKVWPVADKGWFERILRSHGHEGPATETTVPITVDGATLTFRGTRVGEGVAVQAVVAAVRVEVYFWDGWPLDHDLRLQRREGADLDAMLTWPKCITPPNIPLLRQRRPTH